MHANVANVFLADVFAVAADALCMSCYPVQGEGESQRRWAVSEPETA